MSAALVAEDLGRGLGLREDATKLVIAVSRLAS